jgi:aminoglycoside phosphotransferase (APT) family kinase protein
MNRKPRIGNQTAAAVLEHHFGKRPARVKSIAGGLTNYVFEAKVGREEVIVRISDDPAKLQHFQKEQWAVRQARREKIPAPEILEVGNAPIEFPYMISVRVRGQDASTCPNRLEVARSMGEYAARINKIKTSGFGNVFDWSRNQLSRNKSWKDFLDNELKVQGRVEVLASQKMLSPVNLKKLLAEVSTMRRWRGRPSLTHGDLRLKNMLLDQKGKICAILDWENCTSNLAPYWELSIALHDLWIDEKEEFIEGYGISPHEYRAYAAGVKTLNILNYAPTIEHAARKKNRARLERLRARLHGAFELHSL